MKKNTATIERDGVTLTLIQAGNAAGQYTLKIGADTNDADFIYEETHYTPEEFKASHILGRFVILYQMSMIDKHLYDLENLCEFYDEASSDGLYCMKEAFGIPMGCGDMMESHSVSDVELTYFENGSTYQVLADDISKDEKRRLAKEYLQSEISDDDAEKADLIPEILEELELA